MNDDDVIIFISFNKINLPTVKLPVNELINYLGLLEEQLFILY